MSATKKKPTDEERLDWIARNRPDVSFWHSAQEWDVNTESGIVSDKSLRAAIDKAMRKGGR